MAVIERFVVLLYDKMSTVVEVNLARKDLFSKKSRSLENIPPTRTALEQHTMHAVFQPDFIWSQELVKQRVIPSPSAWGWESDNSWKPNWTTLSQAKDTCYELIHCGGKKGCTALRPILIALVYAIVVGIAIEASQHIVSF